MKNIKISAKLMVGFLTVAILTVVVGMTGVYGLVTMDQAANSMYSKKAVPLGDLAKAEECFQRQRVQVRNAIIYTGNTEQLNVVQTGMNDHIAQFEAAMKSYEPTIETDTGKQLYTEIMDKYSNIFKPGVLQVLEDAQKGMSAGELLTEMAVTTEAAEIIANDLTNLIQARMTVMGSASDANAKLGQMLLIIIIAVILVSVAVSIALALYISSLISKPLGFVTRALDQIGTKGDLELPSDVAQNAKESLSRKDELGVCARAFGSLIGHLQVVAKALESVAEGDLTGQISLLSANDAMGISLQKMVENLNNKFTEINTASVQVSSGSKQIADGSQLLAQGSMEQSASVEQLSASITDIASKTATNAEMAKQAADLSNTIKGNAEKGSSQMEQMLQAVKEINEASNSISKVIKVIDDIAFQTNILALNAAVEAARAGQHGKGFAVVADEVRNLAAKSAVAAKDTSGLIENSIEKANLGSRIATETSTSLLEIVEGIKKNAEIITQISQLSDEQSAAISQINSGIDQVAKVVQQNSATAEESAAASEEMSGQSNLLKELISQFKLKGLSGGYVPGLSYSGAGSVSGPGSFQRPVSAAEKTAFSLSGDKY